MKQDIIVHAREALLGFLLTTRAALAASSGSIHGALLMWHMWQKYSALQVCVLCQTSINRPRRVDNRRLTTGYLLACLQRPWLASPCCACCTDEKHQPPIYSCKALPPVPSLAWPLSQRPEWRWR